MLLQGIERVIQGIEIYATAAGFTHDFHPCQTLIGKTLAQQSTGLSCQFRMHFKAHRMETLNGPLRRYPIRIPEILPEAAVQNLPSQ